MCGGTVISPLHSVIGGGLSPRVRGNPAVEELGQNPAGSIPACAGEPRGDRSAMGAKRVYPRVCGGTFCCSSNNPRWLGLSPRVRGNPQWAAPRLRTRRSIPACAGEPFPLDEVWMRYAVYPRVCGGTLTVKASGESTDGLSPRVRGNPDTSGTHFHRSGSIPACAGEPSRLGHYAHHHGVYPRVCGGTMAYPYTHIAKEGLSPRVRGNPRAMRRTTGCPRSIPACAGEPAGMTTESSKGRVYPRVCGGTPRHALTQSPPSRSIPACAGEPGTPGAGERKHAVYPRVCGGTTERGYSIKPFKGLSPRVRGNPGRYPVVSIAMRSIPACAGEPRSTAARGRRPGVYPRVCGGTRGAARKVDCDQGLSPRVRGNQPTSGVLPACGASIPACAGEPAPDTSPAPTGRVYPRVCGGTPSCNAIAVASTGLSPRVRGNPEDLVGAGNNAGSIPACAGEPYAPCVCTTPPRVYPRVCGGTGPRLHGGRL